VALMSETARLGFLQSCCAVAEGADVLLSHAVECASLRCPPHVCVAAVLGDALHRMSVLGGREGMPRSLGSVYGGCVTRFLGGELRGEERRVIATAGMKPWSSGVAVSRDGSTLLVMQSGDDGSCAIHEFRVADGSRMLVVGSAGNGPLQVEMPLQVSVAADGFVFVAEYGNDRVQVLTPTLDFHGFVGVGHLRRPSGVCANDDIIAVSESGAYRISMFTRGDGALLRRFGSYGRSDGQLTHPLGLCFMSGYCHVAVADWSSDRVSVFSVKGEFVRHVGVGHLNSPAGVACSAFDELIVADSNNRRVVVFGVSGELLKTMGHGDFTGVVIHGGAIFAQDYRNKKCIIFE
jgi:DNA-binding beta-propeller fold protein YncE